MKTDHAGQRAVQTEEEAPVRPVNQELVDNEDSEAAGGAGEDGVDRGQGHHRAVSILRDARLQTRDNWISNKVSTLSRPASRR